MQRARGWCAWWLLAGLGACDGCGAPAAPGEADAALQAPEPWTMGAADDDAALPPPCRARAEPLRTVLVREARLAAAPGVLGRVFFAEGAVPVGQAAWRPDSAGVIRPEHGRGMVAPAPWPEREAPRFARAGDGWVGLVDRDAGVWLWRARDDGDAGDFERLGPHPAMRVADVACAGASCALLSSRLDAAGAPLHDGATLWLGRADEPAASWARTDLPAPEAVPLAIAAFDGQRVLAAIADPLRVRLVSVREGAATPAVTLSAPHGALAVSAGADADALRPAALVQVAPRGMRCGEPDAGGVGVVVADAAPQRLRSAAAASQASLVPLPGGWLAMWLAPAHCETPRQLLHAAVLTAGGAPVGPVTTVAEADGYALAARGEDVDVWLRLGGGGQPSTVSWLRIACPLPDR